MRIRIERTLTFPPTTTDAAFGMRLPLLLLLLLLLPLLLLLGIEWYKIDPLLAEEAACAVERKDKGEGLEAKMEEEGEEEEEEEDGSGPKKI